MPKSDEQQLSDSARRFLNDNKAALEILGGLVKDMDSVSSKKYKRFKPEMREGAVLIITEWLQRLWDLRSVEDLPIKEDEDSIFNRQE